MNKERKRPNTGYKGKRDRINPDMKLAFCTAYARSFIKSVGGTGTKEDLIIFLRRNNKEGLKFSDEIFDIVKSS